MPQVQVIQPIQQQPKRLRVAAYARVSSDSEDQLNSLAVQVDYYTHLIQENPNWEFAGIYTDEGITGTSTKRREQFNRLMDDCRAGLIDRVLVKSASRFARNTADALSSVRELKSLGVTVAFEKEGFDTETSNGEMLLSIICAVAQEESLSISQNMKWGMRMRRLLRKRYLRRYRRKSGGAPLASEIRLFHTCTLYIFIRYKRNSSAFSKMFSKTSFKVFIPTSNLHAVLL